MIKSLPLDWEQMLQSTLQFILLFNKILSFCSPLFLSYLCHGISAKGLFSMHFSSSYNRSHYPSHQAHCYQVNAIERRMQKFATSISEKLQCNLATHVAVASQVNM